MPRVQHLNPQQRDFVQRERMAQIAPLYKTSHTMKEIGSILGISVNTVRECVQRMLQEWKEEYLESVATRKAEELARLHHIEKQAQQAYEQSKRSKVTRKHKVERTPANPPPLTLDQLNQGQHQAVHDPNNPPMEISKQTDEASVEPENPGDPRWLDLAKDCIIQRMKALGLFNEENQNGGAGSGILQINWGDITVQARMSGGANASVPRVPSQVGSQTIDIPGTLLPRTTQRPLQIIVNDPVESRISGIKKSDHNEKSNDH